MTTTYTCMARTNLVLANKSDSLRTTVPSHIVKQFNLKPGDRIDWELVVENGGMGVRISLDKD